MRTRPSRRRNWQCWQRRRWPCAEISLEQFFAAVVGAGGATSELAKLWPYQQFVISWANEGLNAGDYQRVLALLATIPVTLDEATQTAITSVSPRQR